MSKYSANVVFCRGVLLRSHVESAIAVLLEGEGHAGLVNSVSGHDVCDAVEFVGRLQCLSSGRHVVEELLHDDLRALVGSGRSRLSGWLAVEIIRLKETGE